MAWRKLVETLLPLPPEQVLERLDEDAATLGEKVVLPPFLEPRRQQIVAALKPID